MPNHAALITALILDHPTCVRCLAVKSSMTLVALDTTIGAIETALVLHRTLDRCRACGATETVLSVSRPQ
jgi:hypothetical protein